MAQAGRRAPDNGLSEAVGACQISPIGALRKLTGQVGRGMMHCSTGEKPAEHVGSLPSQEAGEIV